MRRLLFLLAFALIPMSAWATPALVTGQHTICTGAGSISSLTCAFSGAVTAGNIVVVACASGNSTAFTISDSVDGSYTVDTQNTASSLSVALGHKENHSGSSPTITCATGSSAPIQIFIAEFSGVATSTPNDGTPINQLSLGTADPTSGSLTTSSAGSLIIGYFDTGGPLTITAGSGYTIIDKDESGAVMGGGWEYQVGAAGAYNPTVHLSVSGNSWGATVALKAGGGAPPSGCKGLMLGVWSCF